MRNAVFFCTAVLVMSLTGCAFEMPRLPGRGAPANVESTASVVPTAMESQVDYPVDLFEEKDRQEQADAISLESLVELPEATESEVATGLDAIRDVQGLNKYIHAEHDNSQFGEAEGFAQYVGQLSLGNVAYCISSQTGFEDDAVSRERLDHKIVKRNFSYDPGFDEDVHEYFDASGNLLFSIADVDLTGGMSTGKIRLYLPGSEHGVDFYYDDVDIAAVEEYDVLDEGRKNAIGSRNFPMSVAQKEANSRKNQEKYNKKALSVEELANRRGEKWSKVSRVFAYSPSHPLANADGYVEISMGSQFVARLLGTNYIWKMHRYSFEKEENYIMFTDEEGKQLFTFNTSSNSPCVDMYRRNQVIQKGYPNYILQLFPEYIDIEAEIEKENQAIRDKKVDQSMINPLYEEGADEGEAEAEGEGGA